MLRVNGLYGYIQSTYLRSLALFIGFVAALLVLWAGALPALLLGSVGLGLLFSFLGTSVVFKAAMHAFERIPTDFPALYLETLWIPVVLAVVWLAVGLWLNVRLIRATFALRPVSRHEQPRLYNIVENLAITAGLPMPSLEIIDTPQANAFAVGLTPETSIVAVTRGLLDRLSPRELEAVMAHELTHIANRDAQVNVVASVLQGSLMWLSVFVWHKLTRHVIPLEDLFLTRSDEDADGAAVAAQKRRLGGFLMIHIGPPVMFAANAYDAVVGAAVCVGMLVLLALHFGQTLWQQARGSSRSNELGTSVLPSKKWLYVWPVWLLMAITGAVAALAYALAAFVTASISRSRELLADAGAIELTKDGDALCSALMKVAGRDALPASSVATMALMISSSRGGMFATHPPLGARIGAIEHYAREMVTTPVPRAGPTRAGTTDASAPAAVAEPVVRRTAAGMRRSPASEPAPPAPSTPPRATTRSAETAPAGQRYEQRLAVIARRG